jgi:small conductance mechanosensitive channel
MENIFPTLQHYATIYGLKMIGAVVIFFVGRWIAQLIRKLVDGQMAKRKMDETIAVFVSNLTYIALLTFVIIAAIKLLGIDTAGFVAVIAAAGLAIGFALQGSLSNFAAGFLLILFRPFLKGDFIEGAGTAGIVEEIQIFTTILKTPDNKTIIIPNGKIMGDNITNYSANDTRRIDFIFGVGYSDSLQEVRNTLQTVAEKEERILHDPEPRIAVKELGDSSVNFCCASGLKRRITGMYFSISPKPSNGDLMKKTFPSPSRSVMSIFLKTNNTGYL